MWWELAGFSGIMVMGQMTPGPDWVLVTRGAMAHGLRQAVWTATGIACGLMVHAAVAVGGLAMYVRKSETAWLVARWLAACYLVWVAYHMLRPGKHVERDGREGSSGRPFVQGLLCNLLNAKVSLLLASVCALYLDGERPWYWPVALWGVIVVQGWIVWVAWAALLQVGSVRSIYGRGRCWWDRCFAAALLVLAVRLMAGA